MREYQLALHNITEQVMQKHITEQEGINQLQGILTVLEMKETICSTSIRLKINNIKSIISSSIEAFEKWRSEGGF